MEELTDIFQQLIISILDLRKSCCFENNPKASLSHSIFVDFYLEAGYDSRYS